MQQESDTKLYSPFARIDRYRIKLGLTWKQVAAKLNVSVAMLMMTKTGKRSVSDKVISRLQDAEKEAGLESVPTRARNSEQDFYESITAVFLEHAFKERENSRIELRTEDHDRGWIVVPVEYLRGLPPAGYPETVRLSRPDNVEVMKLLREIEETNENQLLLYACLPRERRTPDFMEKLSPLCILLMEEVSNQLIFGDRFYKKAKESVQGSGSQQGGKKTATKTSNLSIRKSK